MNGKSWIFGAALLALLLGADPVYSQNVLVVIADDLGVDYLNRYGEGADPAPTPVLDSLSDNGILFGNAWTNPICSPSRANILTGKYGFRTGIGDAIVTLQHATLDTSEYTVAKAVRDQQDIATAMIGKWHLGHSSQAFRRNPNACGFDHYAGNVEGQLPNYSVWQKTVNGNNINVFQYATTVTVNDAIDWVDEQSGDWFLVLSFNAPHEPFHKPPNNLHSFDGLSTNPLVIAQDPIPYFKAMIEAMDTEIGRFLDHLRSTGELPQTNIIFLGDNGSPPETAQAPFEQDQMKATLYNGGVRVPMIISGPAVISPGRQASELVNSTDLYHTVLELFGGNPAILPTGVARDSRSLLPLIQNSNDAGDNRAWIYGDFFKPSPSFKDGKTITNGSYKLIEFDNGSREFYDLTADPYEDAPLDIGALSGIPLDHYEFLCGELGSLLDTSFCLVSTGLLQERSEVIGVYPNPASGELRFAYGLETLLADGPLTGRVFDSSGKLVLSFPLSSTDQVLNVVHLPPASYHLLLFRNDRLAGRTGFIKQAVDAVK